MLASVKVALVAPETFPPLLRVSPFFRHWYVSGGLAVVAMTVKVVVCPAYSICGTGCVVITGSCARPGVGRPSRLRMLKTKAGISGASRFLTGFVSVKDFD